jgi:hypothetical protein
MKEENENVARIRWVVFRSWNHQIPNLILSSTSKANETASYINDFQSAKDRIEGGSCCRRSRSSPSRWAVVSDI